MSLSQIRGSGDLLRPPVQIDSASASGVSAAATSVAGHHGHGGHFKGASFQQTLPRRGPTPRMPLRNAGSKRGPARAGAIGAAGAETEESEGIGHEPEAIRRPAHFIKIESQKKDDGQGSDSDEGRRNERRFEHSFQTSAAPVAFVQSDAARRGATAAGSTAAGAAAALPAMASFKDVVHFIHSATQGDPSGQSIGGLLRNINAAVLRGEIKLPALIKVSDARSLLIDIFGKGYGGATGLPGPVRALHAMLPLWLVNLGKHRTTEQKGQAAAILSVRRYGPIVD